MSTWCQRELFHVNLVSEGIVSCLMEHQHSTVHFTVIWCQDHKRAHHEPTPFVCEVCGSGFKSRSNLTSHVLHRHQEERKHLCSACHRTFKTRLAPPLSLSVCAFLSSSSLLLGLWRCTFSILLAVQFRRQFRQHVFVLIIVAGLLCKSVCSVLKTVLHHAKFYSFSSSPNFLQIVLKVKALGPPHVLRLWFWASMGMLSLFMSVEFYGDHKTHKVEVILTILTFRDITGFKTVVSVCLSRE